MGLFNHHDNRDEQAGYVSPFDASGVSDYIDPTPRAEELSDIVDATQEQRKQYRRQPTTPPVTPQSHGVRRGRNRAIVWIVIAVIIVTNFGAGLYSHFQSSLTHVSLMSTFGGSDRDNRTDSGNASDESESPDGTGNGLGVNDVTIVEKQGELLDYDGNQLAKLTIAKATAGPPSAKGLPTVIISFKWVHYNLDDVSFDSIASPEVFQGGRKLNQITFSPSQDVPGYDVASSQTKVASAKDYTTTLAYTLRDEVTPIYVQSGRAESFTRKTLVVSAFTIGADHTFTQVRTDSLDSLRQATQDDKNGMTSFPQGDGETLFLRIGDARRGPDDDNGDATALVSIDWINDTGNERSLTGFGSIDITQGGQKLANARYTASVDGYYDGDQYADVKPGIKVTTTFAVVPNDDTTPLQVTFTPQGQGKPQTATLPLQ